VPTEVEGLLSALTRRRFLEVAAAASCSALLPGGCQQGGATDGSVTPSNGVAVISFSQFTKLQTVGGGVVVQVGSEPIAVVRTGETTATALSAVCPHEGCTVEIETGSPPLYCACHGSEFDLNGAVLRGPARSSLRVYTAVVDATGVTVTLA
jgi:cytochrome b6-f complex iron-sulfur subunit